jgi:hypothetical protein
MRFDAHHTITLSSTSNSLPSNGKAKLITLNVQLIALAVHRTMNSTNPGLLRHAARRATHVGPMAVFGTSSYSTFPDPRVSTTAV